MRGSLLAPPTATGPLAGFTATFHGRRVVGSVAPESRSCLDHADQDVRASACGQAAEASRTDNHPVPRLRSAVARSAVLVHSSFTSRSGNQHITSCGRADPASPSIQPSTVSSRVGVAGRAPSHLMGPLVRIRTQAPANKRREQDRPAAPPQPDAPPASVRSEPQLQSRSPSRASSPTSHLRPTRSSARIRLTDQPCATCRHCR
jgi:hypothetical protein